MTTFTIVTPPPYTKRQIVDVLLNDTLLGRATILRVSPHELLVRVGDRALAFQRHDGTNWTWTE